jgi:ubiquinone/menaquinone biosynthesis C-methylase UbiE
LILKANEQQRGLESAAENHYHGKFKMVEIFDEWPEKYDRWFTTPIGRLVKKFESDLLLQMVNPRFGEKILDAGCGTGIFTLDLLTAGATVVGLELSLPMLNHTVKRSKNHQFHAIQGSMLQLPFEDHVFDKAVSVTAIEFIEKTSIAVAELFRVVRPGGSIVVATLNSLSPWADRRMQSAKSGHDIFRHARFRSPGELEALAPTDAVTKTAIHFQKHEDPELASEIEQNGMRQGLKTGAFLVAHWQKQA